MGVDRLRPPHRSDDGELPERIVEMVVATDHVGHAHVVVVDDDRQHVGGRSVGAEQDEVVELDVLHCNTPLDLILDDGLAFPRRLQADDEGLVALLVQDVAPRAFDPERPALRLGLRPLLGELFLSHVAAIGVAAAEQPVRDLGVARPELRLVIFVAVPVEAEPPHPVEDGVDRLLGGARLVGVLDAQEELAAVMPREQPVEERRPRPADMQKAGGRGGETGDDGTAFANQMISACASARFPLF